MPKTFENRMFSHGMVNTSKMFIGAYSFTDFKGECCLSRIQWANGQEWMLTGYWMCGMPNATKAGGFRRISILDKTLHRQSIVLVIYGYIVARKADTQPKGGMIKSN